MIGSYNNIGAVSYTHLYEIAKNTSSLTFKEFKALVNKFYGYGVHKAILDGYAYAYGYGIGCLLYTSF